MPELAEAAVAARVKLVLLSMEATVPIVTFPVVLIMLPTEISVVNAVPTPVTVLEVVRVVIVPVRVVFGHAEALQLPAALLVIDAADAVCPKTAMSTTIANGIIKP
jgi:hypothetical protein